MNDKPSQKLIEQTLLPQIERDILNDERAQKVLKFLEEHGLSLEKFDPKNFDVLEESFFDKKKAYPNYDQYMAIPGQHDLQKWLLSVKNIYYRQKAGLPYKDAIRQATQGWKKMEIYDFLNWLKYYQEGAQMKYKTAQVWYENPSIPGYFLEIKKDKEPIKEPEVDLQAVENARLEKEQETFRNEEKRRIIEQQRKKIIGRLDSTEKLLRSYEGHQFAGPELESLMEAIYGLKKKVQLVNKLSISTRLYEDMIVREANILSRQGFVKAANMLYSVAQTPGAAGQDAQGSPNGSLIPSTSPPPDPSGAGQSGTMSGLPATAPGVPSDQTTVNSDQNDQPTANALLSEKGTAPTGTAESSPAIIPQDPPQPKGIQEFIENMNEGLEAGSDNLEVSDPEEELMVSEAQAIPPTISPAALKEDVPMTDAPPPERGNPVDPETLESQTPPSLIPTNEEPLEVAEKDIPAQTEVEDQEMIPSKDSGFDAKLDQMLANVSVSDIISELEDLSKVFKVREIPRRLALIDMMLDAKNLSSFFVNLSEAQNKALESNNYISTRIEDILSKLRGSIPTKEIDLKGGPATSSPEVDAMRGKLQTDEEKEKQRKKMRKEQEVSDLNGKTQKETPQVDIGELGQPTTPTATPIQPKV